MESLEFADVIPENIFADNEFIFEQFVVEIIYGISKLGCQEVFIYID